VNSREMKNQNQNLKLTEKEINSIIYLFRAKKPVKVNELQSKVWSYQSELETHTVETHIYRLRKKILNKFNDNNFIYSTVDGYQIK
jgi:DNA-binding response OmpR family regulator